MFTEDPKLDNFLASHRWAVLTSLRASGHPVSSVVAYACEGNQLVVSTPGSTFKRKMLDADPRVNLCAISNAEPFNFVAIEGVAEVQIEDVAPATRLVFKAIEDTGYALPDPLDEWLKSQQRVILRITPQRVSGVIR